MSEIKKTAQKAEHSVTMITNNLKQPYGFSINIDQNGETLQIQAKNKLTKDTYMNDLNSDSLKKIGYHQSVKGFYTRLKLALESKQSEELRASYWFYYDNKNENTKNGNNNEDLTSPNFHATALILTLEEKSKYDEDCIKYSIPLKQLQIKDTVKLSEKLEDVADTIEEKYAKTNQKLEHIVQQIKQKFNTEKEERAKLENRVEQQELLCKKMLDKMNELQNALDKAHNANSENHTQKENISVVAQDLSQRMNTLETKMEEVNKKNQNEMEYINKQLNEFRPKLTRLKTRKEFKSEQSYIEYVCKTLETWDSNNYGKILVRVNSNNATGKAKQFVNFVGEPVKWNQNICKVMWYGIGKKEPEPVDWKSLDVFLPLSAYYYPDCPHAKMGNYEPDTADEQL